MSKVKSFKYEGEEFTTRETEDCEFVVTDELGAEARISVVPNSRPTNSGNYVQYRGAITGLQFSGSTLPSVMDYAARHLIESRLKPITQEGACEIARKEFDELPEQR